MGGRYTRENKDYKGWNTGRISGNRRERDKERRANNDLWSGSDSWLLEWIKLLVLPSCPFPLVAAPLIVSPVSWLVDPFAFWVTLCLLFCLLIHLSVFTSFCSNSWGDLCWRQQLHCLCGIDGEVSTSSIYHMTLRI